MFNLFPAVSHSKDLRETEVFRAYDILLKEYEQGPLAEAARLYIGLGSLSFLSDPERSLAAYTRATQLDPENTEAHIARGDLLSRLDRPSEAEQAYAEALEMAENQSDKQRQLKSSISEKIDALYPSQ